MTPKFKRILFCTQLGPNASHILAHAFALARCFDAKITVLHVRQVLTVEQESAVEGYSGKHTLHDVTERETRAAEKDLHKRIETYFAKEAGGDWHQYVDDISVVEGKAREEIVRHIDSVKADLVVMGEHRHGLLELLLGTTTQQVIARSRVPVLVVPVPETRVSD